MKEEQDSIGRIVNYVIINSPSSLGKAVLKKAMLSIPSRRDSRSVRELPGQNKGSSSTYLYGFKAQQSLHGRQEFKRGAVLDVDFCYTEVESQRRHSGVLKPVMMFTSFRNYTSLNGVVITKGRTQF